MALWCNLIGKWKTVNISNCCPNRIGQKANFIRWLGELVGTNHWTNHGKEFEASKNFLKKKDAPSLKKHSWIIFTVKDKF
jgi:hypothetical protein